MDISMKGISLAALFTPEKIGEKQKTPVKDLSQIIFNETLKALNENQYDKFDAAAMDFGCERQALKNYKCALSEKTKVYTKKENGEIYVGKKMAFLLQCYLLRYIRKTIYDDKNKVKFVTDLKLYQNLKVTGLSKATVERIVWRFRCRVSEASARFVEKQSRNFTLLIGDKLQLNNMLKKDEKYICSSFYSLKLAVLLLKKQQAPILIKKIAPEEEKCNWGVICQSKAQNEEFEPVEWKATQLPIVVFTMYVDQKIEQKSFANKLVETGISSIILYNGAIAEQVIQNDQEISECKDNKKDNALFLLDHVYLSTLDREKELGVQL